LSSSIGTEAIGLTDKQCDPSVSEHISKAILRSLRQTL